MNNLWTPRVYTPKGFVKENILEGAMALDLGCGNRKLPGAVGVDSLQLPAVDVVHDLSQFPWPFKDNSADLVFTNHFMEHTSNFVKTMEEVYRILRPGGRLVMQVPYFRSVDAFNDPTHTRFFSSHTLDYFIEDTKLFEYRYSKARFTQKGFWYGWPHPSKNPFKRAFKNMIEKRHQAYDQYSSLIFPAKCLTWELEAIK
jgi:ubiquinone/menaquinone biosynthesis C-methylase UbiE